MSNFYQTKLKYLLIPLLIGCLLVFPSRRTVAVAIFGDDAFTDTSGTSLQSHSATGGGTWSAGSALDSNAVIDDSNRVRGSSDDYHPYYFSAVPTRADYSVQADIVFVTAADSNSAFVTGRMSTSADTFYAAGYDNDRLTGTSGTEWKLIKKVAGTYTELGSYTQSQSDGASHKVKLEMTGTSIAMYIDGVERVSITDSDISAAGRAGIFLDGAADNTSGWRIDNWQSSASSAVNIIDATTGNGTTANPSVLSYTLPSNVDCLVVAFSYQSGGNTVSDVTYGGVSMTQVESKNAGPGGQPIASIYYLLRSSLPSAGAHDIAVSQGAGGGVAVGYAIYALAGVDQLLPVIDHDNISGTGSASSLTVDGESGGLVVDALALFGGSPAATVDASQAEIMNGITQSTLLAGSSYEAGATTVSMDWGSFSSTPNWAYVTASFKPAPPYPPPARMTVNTNLSVNTHLDI